MDKIYNMQHPCINNGILLYSCKLHNSDLQYNSTYFVQMIFVDNHLWFATVEGPSQKDNDFHYTITETSDNTKGQLFRLCNKACKLIRQKLTDNFSLIDCIDAAGKSTIFISKMPDAHNIYNNIILYSPDGVINMSEPLSRESFRYDQYAFNKKIKATDINNQIDRELLKNMYYTIINGFVIDTILTVQVKDNDPVKSTFTMVIPDTNEYEVIKDKFVIYNFVKEIKKLYLSLTRLPKFLFVNNKKSCIADFRGFYSPARNELYLYDCNYVSDFQPNINAMPYKIRLAYTTDLVKSIQYLEQKSVNITSLRFQPITDPDEIAKSVLNGGKVICVLPDMDYNMHRTDAMIILTE